MGGTDLATAWSIVDSNGHKLLVISVSGSLSTITLVTGEQDQGETYTISVPTLGIVSASTGYALIPPYTVDFTGQGAAPQGDGVAPRRGHPAGAGLGRGGAVEAQ